MKRYWYRAGVVFRLFGITAAILMSLAGALCAAPLESEIISFSPGTTISSSQVNQNFQAIVRAMPALAPSGDGLGHVTLSYTPQTVISITVTPPMDGVLMFIASAQVRLDSGANPDLAAAATAKLCLTETPLTCGSAASSMVVNLAAPTYPLITSLSVPVTYIEMKPCTANTPVTYHLAALQLAPSAGLCVVEGANLHAVFLPGILSQ